jgi:hypothetical protein
LSSPNRIGATVNATRSSANAWNAGSRSGLDGASTVAVVARSAVRVVVSVIVVMRFLL